MFWIFTEELELWKKRQRINNDKKRDFHKTTLRVWGRFMFVSIHVINFLHFHSWDSRNSKAVVCFTRSDCCVFCCHKNREVIYMMIKRASAKERMSLIVIALFTSKNSRYDLFNPIRATPIESTIEVFAFAAKRARTKCRRIAQKSDEKAIKTKRF